jgi:hypothetical protein
VLFLHQLRWDLSILVYSSSCMLRVALALGEFR